MTSPELFNAPEPEDFITAYDKAFKHLTEMGFGPNGFPESEAEEEIEEEFPDEPIEEEYHLEDMIKHLDFLAEHGDKEALVLKNNLVASAEAKGVL